MNPRLNIIITLYYFIARLFSLCVKAVLDLWAALGLTFLTFLGRVGKEGEEGEEGEDSKEGEDGGGHLPHLPC